MSKITLTRTLPFALAAIWLLMTMTPPAGAQFQAGIQGVVLDPNGATVPDAKVTLTNQETNVERTATTNAGGVFVISALPPGKYTLSVEKTGFTKKVLSDVVVTAEQTQSLKVQLDVGEVSQSVTVTAGVPLIDTESAAIGDTITTKEIQSLPSFSRDPYQLLRLAPGTFGDAAQGAGGSGTQLPGTNKSGPGSTDSIFQVENGPGIIANGTRQNANNFQIDGLSVNSTVWGGSAVVTPNEESVKEVRVISNNYSAENGRTSGAQIEVVSQNGTNDLHGSAFFKWHRPGLNAYQRYNGPGTPSPVVRDNARFNQFGGSLGGPLWRNKLFAFFSYETLRNNSQNVTTNWFETPQFEANAGPANSIARQYLSYPGVAPIVTQLISQTCAQAGIPSTQCHDVPGGLDLGSPLKTPLGSSDPTFAQTGTPFGIGSGFDGIPDAMDVQTVNPTRTTDAQYNGRMDYNPSVNDVVTFSIYWTPVAQHSLNGFRAQDIFNHFSTANAVSGIYTHTFTPTLLNEIRFGFTGWQWNEVTSNPQSPLGFPIGMIDNGGVPFQQFGSSSGSIFNQRTYNGRDILTKVQGSHYLKFGADISYAKALDVAPWDEQPTYHFHNLWDFANDAPYKEVGNFNPVTGTPTEAAKNDRFNILAFFVQDDWKIKPNLTLNLGLRYEYFSPLTEKNGNLSNVILGASGTNALADLSVQKGNPLFYTSTNNWGPQIGFAWTPSRLNNKFVVRGGGGIGYNLEQLAITTNGRFNPPFLTNFTLTGSNLLYALGSNVHDINSYPSNPATIQTFDSRGLPTTGAPVSLSGYPIFEPSTMTYRYSLDTQYDLGHNWVASVGYQGSQSRHLGYQSWLNLTLYPQSNPRVQSLDWYSNEANSGYNALLTELQHRFSSNFEFDFQYRFSRNTDIGSQDYFIDNYPWNLSHAHGPADFDVTHNFKLYGVWSPKIFGGSHAFLERVAGGWTLSGIITLHSGFPWTPQYCNTNENVVYPGSNSNGPNGAECLYPAAYLGGAGTDYSNATFMKPNGNFPKGALAYLTVPTFPTFGIPPDPAADIHRNMFRGPGYFGTDMVLEKAFSLPKMKVLGEGAKLNLEVMAYNVFNKINLYQPGGNNVNGGTLISTDGVTSNQQFGESPNAFAGRIIELQARFSF